MRITIILALCGVVSLASAAPIHPTISGYDFAVIGRNALPYEYVTNLGGPDLLSFTPTGEREVVSLSPSYPNGVPLAVMNMPGNMFGGDFELNVMFTAFDNTSGLPVDLIGTGANPQGGDLRIYGSIPDLGLANALLWEIDLTNVVLYGANAGSRSYVLEGVGPITGGLVAVMNGLIGQQGALRGHLDFTNNLPTGWIPAGYSPDMLANFSLRASFSGETGLVPEPAALLTLLVGVGLMRRR